MPKIMRFHAAVVALVLAASPTIARAQPSSPIDGLWMTEGEKAIVEFAPCGDDVCGSVHQILKPDPGSSPYDVHNPDASLRGREVLGLQIFTDFAPSGDKLQGRVYDTRSGKTYKAYLQMQADGTLRVIGCLFIFCQGQTWHRVVAGVRPQ